MNLNTTSQTESEIWCAQPTALHGCPQCNNAAGVGVLKLFDTIIHKLDFCRYSTVTVRLHAPIAEYHRVNSLPILFLSLLYVYVCVHVCFFMKSLSHDFDYIDYFVTFVLCWKDSSTSKSNYKINNLNRVCRKDMLLRTLCMRTPTTNEFKAADSVKQTAVCGRSELLCFGN